MEFSVRMVRVKIRCFPCFSYVGFCLNLSAFIEFVDIMLYLTVIHNFFHGLTHLIREDKNKFVKFTC